MRSFPSRGVLVVAFLSFGCNSNQANRITDPVSFQANNVTVPSSQSPSSQTRGSPNGSAGDMPAYYDSTLLTINFKELPSGGEENTLANNKSINTIWMSDPGLPGGKPFISVLDAIQGDGFNPLWREIQITFNAGFTPRQFFSDTEILTAAAGDHPEITLAVTNEVYRCSVVGPK